MRGPQTYSVIDRSKRDVIVGTIIKNSVLATVIFSSAMLLKSDEVVDSIQIFTIMEWQNGALLYAWLLVVVLFHSPNYSD